MEMKMCPSYVRSKAASTVYLVKQVASDRAEYEKPIREVCWAHFGGVVAGKAILTGVFDL